MKNAVLIVSGVALGLLVACVSMASTGSGLPQAEAQTVQADPAGGPAVVMGIGGAAQNQNDNCWVLFKEKAKNREGKEFDRVSLCLYKILNNGQAFDLVDAREITFDGKLSQLTHPQHNKELAPQVIKKKYEDTLKREEEERQRPPQANGNR